MGAGRDAVGFLDEVDVFHGVRRVYLHLCQPRRWFRVHGSGFQGAGFRFMVQGA